MPMDIILSILFPILESFRGKAYDVGGTGLYIALGIGFLLVVGTVVAILIVVAVKVLKYLRNKNK